MSEGDPKPRRPLTATEAKILADAKRTVEQVVKPFADSMNSKALENVLASAKNYENLLAGLKASFPRVDEVIRQAGMNATDLRSMLPPQTERTVPIGPLKTGTEYAIERVEREIGQLARIAAAMAENTQENAELQRVALTQAETLVEVVQTLDATTNRGIAANKSSSNTLIIVGAMMLVPTLLILFLTAILVFRGG